ncbi:MAG: peptidylprolyl isomerase [Ruminococcaceae bacterium]|nr:peptidylprolyl isomerase [Oscillospiraceae bacterium]
MENNNVLAVVGGKQITNADVDAMIASMGQQGQAYMSPQGRAMILEELIAQKLLLLDATRNLFEREPAFKEQLARVKEDLLINYAVGKVVSGVRVTDDEAKKFFDENPDQFMGQETVSASHILVDSEEKANELLAKITAGEISFEDAARENSSCPSSREGGSLGEFGRGQMVPEFDSACFEMEVGEVRGPVQTQFGYHLIRLDGKKAAEPLHFGDVREAITRQLTMEKQQAAYRSKINQLKILYPVER